MTTSESSGQRPKAVIFDAFGTLLQITRPEHPFKKLMREAIRRGQALPDNPSRFIMSQRLSLQRAANAFGIEEGDSTLLNLNASLAREIASIEVFVDGVQAVEQLQAAGIKVCVCSNLAEPYGEPFKQAYPELDGYVFSFESGTTKPDEAIYQRCLSVLDMTAAETWMVGDSMACDRDGPLSVGISGHWLNRAGASAGFKDLMSFARHCLNS